jgi:hypothetical protein
MTLPQRIPKKAKRQTRWHSPAHLAFVRKHACSMCGSMTNIEAAHIRILGSGGMGRKGHDFFAVSLCHDCHMRQHTVGERSFWGDRDIEALVQAFCRASPKRLEIERERQRWDGR